MKLYGMGYRYHGNGSAKQRSLIPSCMVLQSRQSLLQCARRLCQINSRPGHCVQEANAHVSVLQPWTYPIDTQQLEMCLSCPASNAAARGQQLCAGTQLGDGTSKGHSFASCMSFSSDLLMTLSICLRCHGHSCPATKLTKSML